jgi:hypothetical protein
MTRRTGLALLLAVVALNVIGVLAGYAALALGRDEKRRPEPIVPTASQVTVDAPELPYTFGVPSGFVQRPFTGEQPILVPEPWLPTSINIELSHSDLRRKVSSADQARDYVSSEWAPQRGFEILESLAAADGSPALVYRTESGSEPDFVVFHGYTAVRLRSYGSFGTDQDQSATLREAIRTLIRSMRFR